ncbi:MAG: DUF1616 domain-containing protein, partial [Armatimonadia bacterium]|nr:DUF1616 domain-containing protein [Armatimonadia bacterium]
MDLILVVSTALVTLPLAWLTEGPLRIIVGATFVLFLPGYSLIAALYPLRRSLDLIERLALSFGTSIAVVPLIGLVLNYTAWGIRLTPVMLSVFAFILIMCGVAWYRRSRVDEVDRYSPVFRLPRVDWAGMERTDRILSVALALSILFAVGTLVYVVATPRQGEQFTEFYILGPSGLATGYPESIPVGESDDLLLGIVNHEGETVSYRVETRLDGDPEGLAVECPGPDVTTLSPYAFEVEGLQPEYEWLSRITLSPQTSGERMKAELLLFSPRPRVDTYLRALMGEEGYVSLKV